MNAKGDQVAVLVDETSPLCPGISLHICADIQLISPEPELVGSRPEEEVHHQMEDSKLEGFEQQVGI